MLDLGNTRKKFDDEDIFVILLNSLPYYFDEIRTTIKYGRDSLTTSIVINAIRSKDFETKTTKDKSSNSRTSTRESYYLT